MASQNAASGSALGKSLQVNVDILGGLKYNDAKGNFQGLPVSAGALDTETKRKTLLSSSFGDDAGTIIQALNHLKAVSVRGGSAGITGSIQLSDASGGFVALDTMRILSDSGMQLNGRLNVTGAVDMASTLQVDGVPTFSAGAVFSNGITTAGAIGGGSTLALSGLASVASISMDDGSTLGPDSVPALWTFSAAGDTTQANGAYDFDIASHDGTNGLKLGGVLVDASATDLNYTNVAAIGTAEASKALVVDVSKNISGIAALGATGVITGGSFTDGSMTITGGAITGGVTGDFSGQVSAGSVLSTGAVQGSSLTDGTMTITGGNITSGVNATLSGQVQAATLVVTSTANVAAALYVSSSAPALASQWADLPKFVIQGTDAAGAYESFHIAVSGGILRAIEMGDTP